MDPTLLLEIVAAAGLAAAAWLLLGGRKPAAPSADAPSPVALEPSQDAAESVGPQGLQKAELFQLIRSLPGMVVLLGDDGMVLFASAETTRLSLTRRGVLAFEEVVTLAQEAQARDQVRVQELALYRPPLRKGLVDLRVRAIPLPDTTVLLLIDDLTEEHRVATIRRDFIGNVSHELKTPVGAISLLAEALLSAGDDPAAVQHFAQRMHAEAGRLANLINDVIDLSRLQGEDPLAGAGPVSIDAIVDEAVEYVRSAAEAREIDIIVGGAKDLTVMGMPDQLVTAVRNLLANAVAYSPGHTKVAVAVRQQGATVEVAVKDQGIGISHEDQSRIFERFYRVDAARSRVTGGTGLGLAIVMNVCRNHGGDVSVWSVPDEGSTFTIQLPLNRGTAPAIESQLDNP